MLSSLAACNRGADRRLPRGIDPSLWWERQEKAGILDFANWPYYIDRRRDNSHPSLELFTSMTGIAVNYYHPIRDNATFLNMIRPSLEAGRPIGYDIIVLTNGPELSSLLSSGWLIPLDHGYLEHFPKNARNLVRDPPWDPGNRFTVAWQSGLTGIGYRPEAVEALGRKPNAVADLWDPALAGRVGMLQDEMDLGSFGLLAAGVDPQTSSVYDWAIAAEALREQRERGLVRRYYDQGYLPALQRGEIWISQAWSGDIFQANQLGHPELEFVIPNEGAMFWTDNMMIPLHARHPVDAMIYMDFVYRARVAAMIADYVWYITPVPASREIIRQRYHDDAVADSPLVFPEQETIGQLTESLTGGSARPAGDAPTLRVYYTFGSQEEIELWRRFFGPIVLQGEVGGAARTG